MPARPLELEAEEPKKRPAGIPDWLWELPRKVAEAGRQLGLSRETLAERAGVSVSTISRLLHYKGLRDMKATTLQGLETALHVAPGWLTNAGKVPFVTSDSERPAPRSEVRPSSRPTSSSPGT